MKFLWLLSGIIPILMIIVYNKLIKKEKLAQEAESGIDIQLKRRYDLIPMLVEVTRGYAQHEAQTLEKVTQLRNATHNQSQQGKFTEATQISDTLKTFFMHVESYPALKADKNFQDLHHTIEEVEEQIQQARRYYNATVRDFNTYMEQFPNNLLAKIFRFNAKIFWGIHDDTERQPPSISLP